MMNTYHKSVLLQEVIKLLNISKGEKYIDATLGGGGHSFAILEASGEVLSLDVDQDAIAHVEEKIKDPTVAKAMAGKQRSNPIKSDSKIKNGKELKIVKGNFREIGKIAKENDFKEVAGIIFDLGVSSHQFDSGMRGFSFKKEGPLDMRMDQDLKIKAGDLVNILTKGELYELFTKLGEEGFAHAIANGIVKSRRVKPIWSSSELFGIISQAVKNEHLKLDAAARIYQALRIAVNDELNSLRIALPQAMELLKKRGRIAVISFHSLEDRIVKNQFLKWQEEGKGEIVTKKPITPGTEELKDNKRSRSAKLRIIEKL